MAFVSISYRSEAVRCVKKALQERRCRAKASKDAFIGASALQQSEMSRCACSTRIKTPRCGGLSPMFMQGSTLIACGCYRRAIQGARSGNMRLSLDQVQGQMQLQEDAKCHGSPVLSALLNMNYSTSMNLVFATNTCA